jgi:SepF-like predicted cell division protein (DUF552 family)
MIVKYKADGMWNYIDEIAHTKESGLYFPDYLIEQYEKNVKEMNVPDIASAEGCSEEITKVNKAWLQACNMINADTSEIEYEANTENLVTEECVKNNTPIGIVLIKLRGQKGYSKILVTSQEVYLMNDKGQTIERLV